MTASQPWIVGQLSRPKYNRITREEEQQLFQDLRAGDPRAEERIIAANTRFVVLVATKYVNRGLELEDLIAEGMLGMKRALIRFDEKSGYKFISYAVWWVRQALMTALAEQGYQVKLSTNILGAFMKINRAINQLLITLKRYPTAEELAEATRVWPEYIEAYYRYCVSMDLDIDNTESDDDKREISLVDESPLPDAGPQAERAAAYRELLLKGLKPIEREVLLRYYGLTNQGEQTLEEIGEVVDLTRERIRQIKDRALDRARGRARMLRIEERMERFSRDAMRRAGPISIGQSRTA